VSITAVLRLSDLTVADACGEGLALYRDLLALQGGVHVVVRLRSGERVVRLRTDRVRLRLCTLGQLWLARDCKHIGWLRERGLLPAVSAPCANLSGANLSGANLRAARRYPSDPIPAGWAYDDGVLTRAGA
jgi:uncharacterized protein YjbI with pentapeptide repeats